MDDYLKATNDALTQNWGDEMDREKIINAIEKAKKQSEEYAQDRIIVPFKEADIILALLKEQEAKTGHWVSVNDGDVVTIDNDGFPERACFCSECKKYLIASDEYAVYGKYCPFCGAKMEGR